jgi:hypothetical protein
LCCFGNAPFDEVKRAGFGTVNVVAGYQQSLQVTTDDNLLPWVETEVENGILKIDTTILLKFRLST